MHIRQRSMKKLKSGKIYARTHEDSIQVEKKVFKLFLPPLVLGARGCWVISKSLNGVTPTFWGRQTLRRFYSSSLFPHPYWYLALLRLHPRPPPWPILCDNHLGFQAIIPPLHYTHRFLFLFIYSFILWLPLTHIWVNFFLSPLFILRHLRVNCLPLPSLIPTF